MAATFAHWLNEHSPKEWHWTWTYQIYLKKQLHRITTGQSKRLMIFMPPRHGKSEMVTVRYTAWRLHRDPRLRVILGSYGQHLANRFSRSIKRVCNDAGFKGSRAGGKRLTDTIRTAAEWETPFGGGVRAVGTGAGVTGFGAGLIMIDDPVKNRAQAESPVFRERVWEWFNDDLYTRLEPDGQIILIQTRWHEDDLAGRLLQDAKEDGEQWDVVNLPALAEIDLADVTDEQKVAQTENHPSLARNDASRSQLVDAIGRKAGQPLCPARFDAKALTRIKKRIGSYSFAALYQQRPSPRDKTRFRREWFNRIVEQAPKGLIWKRGYDLAVSTKTTADYTASFRVAKDEVGDLYIADGFRDRIEYPEQRRYVIARIRMELKTEHGIENALHGKALLQELRREAQLSGKAFRGITVDGDKLTRALSWLNLAEEGKVILVRGAWIKDFLDEVSQFPNGRHDDQVDAVSIAVRMLDDRGKKAEGF